MQNPALQSSSFSTTNVTPVSGDGTLLGAAMIALAHQSMSTSQFGILGASNGQLTEFDYLSAL